MRFVPASELAPVPAVPTARPETEGAAASENCPKCDVPLIDPRGLGWCKKCGFCRSLEEMPARHFVVPSKSSKGRGAAEAAANVPFWIMVLVLGVAVVVGATALVNTRLPPGPKFPRALWCTAQIGVSVFLIWVTQFIALIVLAPKDGTLHFTHAVLPGKIWGLILKRLPAMAPCLWVGAWSVTAIASALFFIGGLSHWNDYLPGKNKQANQLLQAR